MTATPSEDRTRRQTMHDATLEQHDSCSFRFLARHEGDTDRLGQALAAAVLPGLVVSLVGNLGAGKTRLVRSVAAALDVDPLSVASPTFVLIHEYEGRLPVFHFDVYRLRNVEEFLELGAEELMSLDGVCFIEWAERVASALPKDHLRIEIEHAGPTERTFHFCARGATSQRCLGLLKGALSVNDGE